MTARGEDISSQNVLERLMQCAHSGLREEFRALNNQVLRAIVDCCVHGDPISQDACVTLSSLCRSTHRHYASGDSFVFTNLSRTKHPGLTPLQEMLRDIELYPEQVASAATAQLRFSLFPPRTLMDEHPLLEDSLARAAVHCLASTGELDQPSLTFAKLAFAFRTVRGCVFPEREPSVKAREACVQAVEIAQKAIAPLVHSSRLLEDAATRRQEFNDLRALTPLRECLEHQFTSLSDVAPWRPLPFFVRSETLATFQPFKDPRLAGSFPVLEPMIEELVCVGEILDQPGIGSVGEYAKMLLVLANYESQSEEAGLNADQELDIFPVTHATIKALRKLFSI